MSTKSRDTGLEKHAAVYSATELADLLYFTTALMNNLHIAKYILAVFSAFLCIFCDYIATHLFIIEN